MISDSQIIVTSPWNCKLHEGDGFGDVIMISDSQIIVTSPWNWEGDECLQTSEFGLDLNLKVESLFLF